MRWLACVQVGDAVCGSGADQPGSCVRFRLGWLGCRQRALPAHGSWDAVSVRPLPEPAQVLGHYPSVAFVEQPQTNGVAERFNRTLKDQAIHGRVFRIVEEVRAAVGAFSPGTTASVGSKNRFFSPLEIRQQWIVQAALARVA